VENVLDLDASSWTGRWRVRRLEVLLEELLEEVLGALGARFVEVLEVPEMHRDVPAAVP